MAKIKTKIFLGTNDDKADEQFNDWIKKENIDIIKFKYQQARYGDHSICILYKDLNEVKKK